MYIEIIKIYKFDHTDQGKIIILMVLAPNGVEIDSVSENKT